MAQALTSKNKNNIKAPLVSVVMSVYNGEKYLREAVDSILEQTLKDFEFIIIDDGSTDGSLKILESYKDPRIVLISRENKGLVASLNEGIRKAKGKYIARQDCDDVSAPARLQQQLSAMKAQGLVLVSSAFGQFHKNTKDVFIYQCLVDHDELLKRELWVKNPFGHGATMFDKAAARKVGLYRNVGPVEDYDLWTRMISCGKFGYIEEVGYYWRINPDGISQQQATEQARLAAGVRRNNLKDAPPTLSASEQARVLDAIAKLPDSLIDICRDRVIDDQKQIIKQAVLRFGLSSLVPDIAFLYKLKNLRSNDVS